MRSGDRTIISPSFKDTTCASKECKNQGIHYLEIIYIAKSGWFCDKCKNELGHEGLIASGQSFTIAE